MEGIKRELSVQNYRGRVEEELGRREMVRHKLRTLEN